MKDLSKKMKKNWDEQERKASKNSKEIKDRKKRWRAQDDLMTVGWRNYDYKGKSTTSDRKHDKDIRWTLEKSPKNSPFYSKGQDEFALTQAPIEKIADDRQNQPRVNAMGLTDIEIEDLKAIRDKPFQSWWNGIPTINKLMEEGLIEWKEEVKKGRVFTKMLRGYCVTERGREILALLANPP